MKKKFLVFSLVILAILLWVFIIKSSQLKCFTTLKDRGKLLFTEPLSKDLDIPSEDTGCAKAGEKPLSNFDLRTGKTNPDVEVITCCEGLKEIDVKQSTTEITPEPEKRICAQIQGIRNTICAPCGNNICEPEYEDYCNCPEDCK